MKRRRDSENDKESKGGTENNADEAKNTTGTDDCNNTVFPDSDDSDNKSENNENSDEGICEEENIQTEATDWGRHTFWTRPIDAVDGVRNNRCWVERLRFSSYDVFGEGFIERIPDFYSPNGKPYFRHWTTRVYNQPELPGLWNGVHTDNGIEWKNACGNEHVSDIETQAAGSGFSSGFPSGLDDIREWKLIGMGDLFSALRHEFFSIRPLLRIVCGYARDDSFPFEIFRRSEHSRLL
jgi:hypothetical protein